MEKIAYCMDVDGKLQSLLTTANLPLQGGGGGITPSGTINDPIGLSVKNGDVVTIKAGQPVFIDTANLVKKASFLDKRTASVAGLVAEDITYGQNGVIRFNDELELTTDQWDIITGEIGGLYIGSAYFLSSVGTGRISRIPPTSGFIVPIGRAVGPTKLHISIGNKIKL